MISFDKTNNIEQLRKGKLAAIDVGTNSFHLVVVEIKPNGKFVVLERQKEVVRLGEGVTDLKHIGDEAMERALGVLKNFMMIAESYSAPVRAVATSAVREALNRDDFIERARRKVGIEIEVVSGSEEARLIYLGVLQSLNVYNKKILLVDIGGGSTEFLIGKAGKIFYANSLKIGAVRLTRRFFAAETISAMDVTECRDFLAGVLHPIRRTVETESFEMAVGSSGTILNIASMARAAKGKEVSYEEGNVTISKKDLDSIIGNLLAVDDSTRRMQIPGLDPDRADIIIAGALILEQIFETMKLKSITTAKYALREGVILDAIMKIPAADADAHLRDIRKSSVLHLAELCCYDARHAERVSVLALMLFDQLKGVHCLGSAEREFLEAAAILHDVGHHISHSQHHRHSYYLIRNAELLGFTDREIHIIANVARYHRKSHPKSSHENFTCLSEDDQTITRKLSAIIRVADGLDRRHEGVFRSVRCEMNEGKTILHLEPARKNDCALELWGAHRRKDLFEEIFATRIEFQVHFPEES